MPGKESYGINIFLNLFLIISITTCVQFTKKAEYEIDIEKHDRECGKFMYHWISGNKKEGPPFGFTVPMKRVCSKHKHKSVYLIYPENKKFKILRNNKKFYYEQLDLNCTTCSDCQMRVFYRELGLQVKCVDNKIVMMCLV
ncbi:hypothetical protein SNEBB_010590 [Seison nebaliae]|nr:hypothetical protein SNEBB_010590 [Seison nebaliae]